MVSNNQDRERVLRALENAWSREDGVRAFGLAVRPDKVREDHGVWSVPVASGVPQGSARELLRVLDRLEERVEQETHLDITVFLDLNPPAAGHV